MNHQIRVYYEEETYTVSAYSAAQGVMTSSSGNLTSSGAWVNEPIRRGQSFVYTFTPNAGYKVLAVLVDGVSLGSVNSYVIPKPVLRNHQIRVYYEEETYTVSAYSAAQGVITSSSGNLTSSGAWVYESIRRGQSFVYTFAPNAGYKVLDVLVDGVSLGSVNSYVIPKPVLMNHQIRVYYEEDTYTVSAYSAAQGVMTSSSGNLTSSGAWVYEPIFSSQSFVYTFTPNAGYKVLDVLVDGISLGSVNSYAIPIPVIKNHQIRVYYEIE
jgi:DNA-directed RNA polymerase subunit L